MLLLSTTEVLLLLFGSLFNFSGFDFRCIGSTSTEAGLEAVVVLLLQTTTGNWSDLILDCEVFFTLEAAPGTLCDTSEAEVITDCLLLELDLDLFTGDFFLSPLFPPVMFLRKLFSDLT